MFPVMDSERTLDLKQLYWGRATRYLHGGSTPSRRDCRARQACDQRACSAYAADMHLPAHREERIPGVRIRPGGPDVCNELLRGK